MSDFRYQLVQHDGLDCLHVLTRGGDETYIPLDDILSSAVEQGYMTLVVPLAQKISAIAEKALDDTNPATESDWPNILANGLENIITLCKEQLTKG